MAGAFNDGILTEYDGNSAMSKHSTSSGKDNEICIASSITNRGQPEFFIEPSKRVQSPLHAVEDY